MYFEHAGARLYYERHGSSGTPLLLLHGWGCRIGTFTNIIRDFSADRRVIALDFPGHGNSPEPPEPWSVTEYAELLYAFMQKFELIGADAIAHSFGGRVALLLSADHPGAFGRLVLTGCAGLKAPMTAKKKLRSRMYKLSRRLCDNALTRKLFPSFTDKFREALVKKYGSADYKALTPSMRKTFNLVIAQDLAPCLPCISTPTLLIWGENDDTTPIWMGEVMQREMQNAELISMPNCGHFAFIDNYDEFRRMAAEFLSPKG